MQVAARDPRAHRIRMVSTVAAPASATDATVKCQPKKLKAQGKYLFCRAKNAGRKP